VAWAAAGPVPSGAHLPLATRLQLEDVPLAGAPPWLGIDRALAGWRAACLVAGPVLVADAGTVLSLTRVDGRGRFGGGRLMAGAALQLAAMGKGTEALPTLAGGLAAAGAEESWPLATVAAMRSGVAEGLAAAVLEAARQARALEPGCRIVLTGGDGPALMPLLRRSTDLGGEALLHSPDLCLEALVALRPQPPAGFRPDPGPPGSDRPWPRPSP
jgi:type III pantothenate kinase